MENGRRPVSSRAAAAVAVLLGDLVFQRLERRLDALGQLRLVQPADRVLHDQELGLDLARLRLRPDERQEGLGDDDVGFDAALF